MDSPKKSSQDESLVLACLRKAVPLARKGQGVRNARLGQDRAWLR